MEQPSEFFTFFVVSWRLLVPLIVPKTCFNPEFGAVCASKLHHYSAALSRVK